MGKKLVLRCIALLLVLATLSVLVISCGGDDTDTNNNNNNNSTNNSNNTNNNNSNGTNNSGNTGNTGNTGDNGDNSGNTGDNGDPDPDDNQVVVDAELPEAYDMGGYIFTALARETEWFANEVYAEDETGDQILQAVYDRNWAIEERYKCVLDYNLISESDFTTWSNSVKSGESIYKIGLQHMMETASESLNGTMLNIRELPVINLQGEWWNQSLNKELTVNGKLYFTANQYCTSSVYFTWLMIFNMAKCQEKNIDVYGLIDSGDWTIDKLYEIVSTAYGDANGNKQVDIDDNYGLVTHWNTVLTNYIFAFNIPVTRTNASTGKLELAFNDAETPMIAATEKIYNLLFNSANGTLYFTDELNNTHYKGILHDNAIATKFSQNDSALFANVRLLGLETLREAETVYGIIPFPKYTKDQSNYYSHVDGRGSLMFVPYTLPESEYQNVGTLIEALTIATHKDVMPVIQLSALLGRYSEDAQAYKCLEMTLAGRTYAFAYVFNSELNSSPYWSIVSIMKAKSNNFTNHWKTKARSANRELSSLLTTISKIHATK